MDPKPERRSNEQSLAADRRDQFFGMAPTPAAAARRRFFAKALAASLVAHGCLVLAFVLLDQATHPSGSAREIPVKVVTEPPPPAQRPAAPEAGEKPAAPKEAAQAQSREPRQMPQIEVTTNPANEAKPGPNRVAKPAAPQPSASGGPEASAKPVRKDVLNKAIVQEDRPPAKQTGGPARQGREDENRLPVQTGLPLPFDSGPDSFRAVAVPLPAANGGEAMSYKVIVLGLLARVKHYPETARRRHAKGIAIIGFALDESGGVGSVSLLRSSGDADLDAESVALVNRAAPFPPPPPGAKHSFAIEVAFGMGN